MRMKAKYAQYVVDIYPESLNLHPDCQGALLSLVINRGNGLIDRADKSNTPEKKKNNRKEMREIQQALSSHNNSIIPSLFRSMKRLWEGDGIDGLIVRREKEAAYFEGGLNEN